MNVRDQRLVVSKKIATKPGGQTFSPWTWPLDGLLITRSPVLCLFAQCLIKCQTMAKAASEWNLKLTMLIDSLTGSIIFEYLHDMFVLTRHDLGSILTISHRITRNCFVIKSSYKWIIGYEMFVLRSKWQWHQGCDSWVLTRWPWYAHTPESLWWDVRCSMFPCLCCDLWRCSCWMCTLYSILHSSQYSGVRTTIQDPPWTAAEAAWARVSLTQRPGIICLGLACWVLILTTLPKLFRGYSVNTLPCSHIISKDLRNFSSFVS